MNARQKAKYYKKRCKMLEDMVLPLRKYRYDMTNLPIVTLRSEQIIRNEEMRALTVADDLGLTMVNKIMARDFINQILNYADIVQIEDKDRDCKIIRATMKVVDMRKEVM